MTHAAPRRTNEPPSARHTQAKIVATIGPATDDKARIRALHEAGANVFRLNFSHGSHADHQRRHTWIREIEAESGRPIAILMDLQGPKLRIGSFAQGSVLLEPGQPFVLDMDAATPGSEQRVAMPHPEIFAALRPGTELLLDDGRLRLRVTHCGADHAHTVVTVGGMLSNRKGVNVPGVLLPICALTDKDCADLEFGLSLGVDWVALSFVQRASDIAQLRQRIAGRAAIVAKLEKPAAIDALESIVAETDAVMVARGDLGVEMPAEQVPAIQRQIIRACRRQGRPVIVATQMLESMIGSPVPTRAEASDVATAIYEGADAVMLSAESASGHYPLQAVQMMQRIIEHSEADPTWREGLQPSQSPPEATVADAIGLAMRHAIALLQASATVAYTSSGYAALRTARERPAAPIIGLTPHLATARRLTLVWGVHPIVTPELAVGTSVEHMAEVAERSACDAGFAGPGDYLVISAGLPFATPGTTNLLKIIRIAAPATGSAAAP
ncbi:pyruvate kinase [Vandammella animalimorsus]|uniref:Pyruvate kinase n=1 Tax=Vandammella animalimorsus TaxID=2029117 RepID=A0A3M6RRS2_9BURK|nr:pyruvate kinase [Vandammella animalimorsus]RMX18009.1 pyruvate kinase [Vandammella animalimorsus]